MNATFVRRGLFASTILLLSLGTGYGGYYLSLNKKKRALHLLSLQKTELAPSSLFQAVEENQMKKIGLLLDGGLPVDTRNRQGLTPLLVSSGAADIEQMRYFLQKQSDPNATDNQGRSALAYALTSQKMEAVHTLLENGSSPNGDLEGTHPVIYAVQQNDEGLLSKLLEHGGNPNVLTTDDNTSALQLAAGRKRYHLMEQLLKHKAVPDANLLITASHEGDEKQVAMLLEHGADVTRSDDQGFTALSHASIQQHVPIVRRLLEKGANPNVSIPDANPLHINAIRNRNYEIQELLLEHGAHVEARDVEGQLAISVAAQMNDPKAMMALLKRNATTSEALTKVIELSRQELMDLLIENGADPLGKDPGGMTPLEIAVREHNNEMVNYFLAKGAHPEIGQVFGQPLLSTAVIRKDHEMAETLLKHGANPDTLMLTPFDKAFYDLSENNKFRFYLRKDDRFRPIMLAVGNKDTKMVQLLMHYKASTSVWTKKYSRYPISFASELSDIPTQQALMGVDPEKTNRKIVVDLSSQRLTFYEGDTVKLSSTISSGKRGHRTRTGMFTITNKYTKWRSTLYNSEMPYFMRLSCGDFGFHYGVTPGYPASHGCIRMPMSKVKSLYSIARLGDKVIIQQ